MSTEPEQVGRSIPSGTSIAAHLQRLVRVAFQDVDLYSPPERSDADVVTAARHLSELESLLVDRLVAILPPSAKVEHAVLADLLGGVRHEYVRLLKQRVGARLAEPTFSPATWACARTDAGIVEDRSWEDRTARIVLERAGRRADGSLETGAAHADRELTDAEVLALTGDRLVLEFPAS